MRDDDLRLMAEGRMVSWEQLADLEDGATVQVLGNIRGGMGKKSKMKKVKNPWGSEDGSGTRSGSAEEQFEETDKEMIMENHRRALGSAHIDVLAEVDTEVARDVDEVPGKYYGNTRRSEEYGGVELDVDG